MSSRGYIKRLPCDTYHPQGRGGKGIKGMIFREEDTLRHMLVADTLDYLLFFTNRGRVLPAEGARGAGIQLARLRACHWSI